MLHIHDKAYKRLFSNRTIFRQLLETFVPESWVGEIDFERGEPIDKTFIDKRYRSRESDLIYKLPLGDSDVYIYIILEFQSSAPRFMALRVLNYLTGFYMDYVESHKKTRMLPPVFPIVLYNGDGPWTPPDTLADLVERSDLLGPYQVDFRYFKIAENELDRESLLTASNIVSTLFLAESHYDLRLLKKVLLDIFDNESDRQAVSLFLNWFTQWAAHGKMPPEDYYEIEKLYTDREEVTTMIETAIERYMDKLRVEMEPKFREEMEPKLRAELEPKFREEMEPKLRAELEPELRAELESELRAELEAELREKIQAEQREKIRAELRTEQMNQVALTMLAKGLDTTLIAEATGLTPSEIETLRSRPS